MAPRQTPLFVELSITNAYASALFDFEIERLGLRTTQAGLLELIDIYGPATPTELEQISGLPGTTLRARIGTLIADGYVERLPNERDRRSHFVGTTSQGRRFLTVARRALRTLEQAVSRALGSPLEPYDRMVRELRLAEQRVWRERVADEDLAREERLAPAFPG